MARWRGLPHRTRADAASREMKSRSGAFLEPRLSLIDLALEAPRPPQPSAEGHAGHIWQYWDRGLQHAPAVVKMALGSVQRHAWAPVRLVTDTTIADYVTLPDVVLAKRHLMTPTHFSDVLRLHLLAAHGGCWLDATVMLTGPRPRVITSAPFFAFTRPEDPFLLSSWYLQAAAGEPLVRAWRDALVRYWEQHDTLVDYFLCHFLFEAMVTCQGWARRRWMATPVVSFEGPHRLQSMLPMPYVREEVAPVLQQEWLHKLTYKMDLPSDSAGTTVGGWLLRNT